MKMANGWYILAAEDEIFELRSISLDVNGNVNVFEYRITEEGWEPRSTIPTVYTDIKAFLSAYLFASWFDFDKFTFNYDNNMYETNEVIKYEQIIEANGNTSESTISEFKVRFIDNKPVYVEFNLHTKNYKGDTIYFENDSIIYFGFSDLGTTVIEQPTIISND